MYDFISLLFFFTTITFLKRTGVNREATIFTQVIEEEHYDHFT